MTDNGYLLLEILKSEIHGTKPSIVDDISDERLKELYKLADSQQILPIVYRILDMSGTIDSNKHEKVKQSVKRKLSEQMMRTAELLHIYSKLRAAGIRPIIVKGLALRSIYPNPDYRTSCDEDVYVSEHEFEIAHRLMLEYGMELLTEGCDIHAADEVSYKKRGTPLYIELHKSLFPKDSDIMSGANVLFSEISQNAVPFLFRGFEILMPDYTSHLIFLILHLYKHFIHSGVGIRPVCDIALFSYKFKNKIDWEKIISVCREYSCDYFMSAIYKIADKYLSIPSPEIFITAECDEEALLSDIISGGVLGNVSSERIHSGTVTVNAASNGGKSNKSLLKAIFPPASSLKKKYKYLRKCKLLLPIAWVSRIFKYGIEVISSGGSKAAESIKIGKERTELLRQYKII